jgi:hypothetical protein
MSAPAVSESVSGRTQPRWTGEPVTHEFRWYPANRGASYRHGGLRGECACGETRTVDGGSLTSQLVSTERQHGGTEDP